MPRFRLAALSACAVAVALAAPAPAGAVARIFTVAGDGRFTIGSTPSPLGHVATDVEADAPDDVAVAPSGDVLFTDFGRVWRVGPDGIVRVAAGTGHTPDSADDPLTGDGGPAARATVDPHALAALPDGGFLIAEPWDVRRVWPDGTITTVAGTGPALNDSGDGGPATAAVVEPTAVAAAAGGGFLILEPARVRRVAPDGTITTVAGTRRPGFSGDGGPAVRARIDPGGGGSDDADGDIAATPDGGFLIADFGNGRIRRVAPDGRIATVAGDGRRESRGNGGPAVRASLELPKAVAATADGGFLISEVGRIRRVAPDGTITTVAGRRAFAPQAPGVPVGDGGPARAARIDPWGRGLVATPAGGFVFADFSRIRLVGPGPPRRLDAALTAVGGGTRAPVVRIRSTDAGTATVTVRSPRGRVVASATAAIPAGPAAFRLPSLHAGRYRIHLTVTAPGDRRASVRMAVLLGRAFPVSAARHAAGYELGVDRATSVRSRTCRRFSSRRIDCRGSTKRRCVQIDAVTRRGPFTFVRPYGCAGGFRRAPHWLFQAQPWPMLGSPPPD